MSNNDDKIGFIELIFSFEIAIIIIILVLFFES